MTKLAQTAELGIVPVRIGNVTLRLVTDPALIKRALELDDPPTLGRGRFTRVASWYREGIFVITSGPEHARQRDVLGRPIWNDPQTPEIAQRRATAMAAGVAGGRARRPVADVPPAALRDRLGAADGRAGRRAAPARVRDRRRLATPPDPAAAGRCCGGCRRAAAPARRARSSTRASTRSSRSGARRRMTRRRTSSRASCGRPPTTAVSRPTSSSARPSSSSSRTRSTTS